MPKTKSGAMELLTNMGLEDLPKGWSIADVYGEKGKRKIEIIEAEARGAEKGYIDGYMDGFGGKPFDGHTPIAPLSEEKHER